MIRLLYDIKRRVLVVIPLLLALAPAMSQTVVYQGATTTLAVVAVPEHFYEWELYSDGTVNFVTARENCPAASANFAAGRCGASVMVHWNALGTYFFKVTTRDGLGCAMNLKIGMIRVIRFPVEIDQIITKPDYARISWARDTTINVLENDHSTVDLIPASVQIIRPPALGTTTVNVDGSITYVPGERCSGRDEFEYEVCDVLNLCASAKVTIDIYDSELLIPEGFSPNGDGINDLLVFKGLGDYLQSQLYVYTRSGILVYQSNDYRNNWDGTDITDAMTSQQYVPTGTYYYILKLGGTNRSLKGFIYIGY